MLHLGAKGLYIVIPVVLNFITFVDLLKWENVMDVSKLRPKKLCLTINGLFCSNVPYYFKFVV